MNFSKEETPYTDTNLSLASSKTTLNPCASAFVPSTLREPIRGSIHAVQEKPTNDLSGAVGEPLLDHSKLDCFSTDEEGLEDWNHRLPDDISPDFNAITEYRYHESLSLSALSLSTYNKSSASSPFCRHGHVPNDLNIITDDLTEMKRGHQSPRDIAEHFYTGGLAHQVNTDVISRPIATNSYCENPFNYLTLCFPGFAAESLVEVYIANKCDLNLTIDMLTQLELQFESDVDESIRSKNLLAPNISSMDFPALSASDNQSIHKKYSKDDLQKSGSSCPHFKKDEALHLRNGLYPLDFASVLKKTLQEPSIWKNNGNDSYGSSNGSCGNSQLSNRHGAGKRNMCSDKLQSSSSLKVPPAWLETGEAVSNLYSELREEARDHARIRNAYFEQARRAYLIGNKALAKELSIKGQLYNMHMKAAHEKAHETIYRNRNPRGQTAAGGERLIDLHGLHTSEAIRILRHELNALRSIARSGEKRMEVCICVGTGHHTRGSRTPARLPAAVQRYLLEDERLDFTEPQPGLLQISLY